MEQEIRYCTTSDGIKIAYATVGSGPPIVRTLGWLTHLELEWEWETTRSFWENVAAHHQLVRYDGRGIGLSDPWDEAFTPETRLGDLEAVVDALQLDALALLGLSEGGQTAVRYAVAHPEFVTHLLVFGSMVRFGSERGLSARAREEQQAMLTLVRTGWGRDTPQFRQLFTTLFMPTATPEQIGRFNEIQRQSARPETAARMLDAVYQSDIGSEAERVTAPTLVMHRRDDQISRFAWGRRLAASIPGARFLPLEGDNHFLGTDPGQDAAVVAAVHSFLGDTPTLAATGAGHQTTSAGFRTILFTDVVASTPLLAQLKDARMREVMRDHDAVLQAAVDDHGGRVVKEIGDAFMAEFAVPSAAVECAIAMQRGIQTQFADTDVPIRLRIGINAGEPVEEDGDLHGASVVIAKRSAR